MSESALLFSESNLVKIQAALEQMSKREAQEAMWTHTPHGDKACRTGKTKRPAVKKESPQSSMCEVT